MVTYEEIEYDLSKSNEQAMELSYIISRVSNEDLISAGDYIGIEEIIDDYPCSLQEIVDQVLVESNLIDKRDFQEEEDISDKICHFVLSL